MRQLQNVAGLLRAVGKELYNTTVTSEIVDQTIETLEDGRKQNNVKFKVKLHEAKRERTQSLLNVRDEEGVSREAAAVSPYYNGQNLINPRTFCHLFPFHLLFNNNLEIKQMGVNIYRLSHKTVRSGMRLDETFNLVHPRMPLSFSEIQRSVCLWALYHLWAAEQQRKLQVYQRQLHS